MLSPQYLQVRADLVIPPMLLEEFLNALAGIREQYFVDKRDWGRGTFDVQQDGLHLVVARRRIRQSSWGTGHSLTFAARRWRKPPYSGAAAALQARSAIE